LSIHLVARDVLYDIGTGRLDLASALNTSTFEFWFKVIHGQRGSEERCLAVERADARVRDVLKRFGVTQKDWPIDVFPAPAQCWGNWTLETIENWEKWCGNGRMTLERFGVRSGTTLRVGISDR
jgi:hypothetical protein